MNGIDPNAKTDASETVLGMSSLQAVCIVWLHLSSEKPTLGQCLYIDPFSELYFESDFLEIRINNNTNS